MSESCVKGKYISDLETNTILTLSCFLRISKSRFYFICFVYCNWFCLAFKLGISSSISKTRTHFTTVRKTPECLKMGITIFLLFSNISLAFNLKEVLLCFPSLCWLFFKRQACVSSLSHLHIRHLFSIRKTKIQTN